MKLTILSQYYPPEVGAPQVRLSEIAEFFVARGHEVSVLTALPNYPTGKIHKGYGRFLHRGWRNGVRVIRTFVYPTQKADFIRRLANYFSFVLSSAVLGTCLLGRSDYLLVESPPLFLGLTGVWLSRLKRSRLIFNVSDLWPESAVRIGILRRDSLAFRVGGWLEAFCYKRAWLVTGQSTGIIADIASRFPDVSTFLLSNGVNTRRFGPHTYSKIVRDELSTNCDFVALYAGLHGLAQGLEQILNAVSAFKSRSGFKFAFVGDGPEKRQLIKSAAERRLANIQFIGSRPAPEMPAMLAAADVLLVPLKVHIPGAVPSKLYEAMATGKPVILIADGEAAQIVREHDAGITVSVDDVNGLVRAIETLRADPYLARTLGANGRRAAELHFDRATIALRFAEFLETRILTPESPCIGNH